MFADGSVGVPYILAAGQISPIDCGNGILESGETCDDGNLVSGDGCDDKCLIEPCYNCFSSGRYLPMSTLLSYFDSVCSRGRIVCIENRYIITVKRSCY